MDSLFPCDRLEIIRYITGDSDGKADQQKKKTDQKAKTSFTETDYFCVQMHLFGIDGTVVYSMNFSNGVKLDVVDGNGLRYRSFAECVAVTKEGQLDDLRMEEKQMYAFAVVCGLVVIGISFLVRAKQTPVFTALSYIVGFVVGAVFQTDGFDPGGGKTNNLWMIWTVVFACFTLAAFFADLFAKRKRK